MIKTTVDPWPSVEVSSITNVWIDRHNRAVNLPTSQESGILSALNGWQLYAALCNGQLGEDGVLGDAWLRAGKCLQELLNGELGRLDGGTLDHYIRATMKRAGFNDHEID